MYFAISAGQEKFRVITKAYYRNASGILIVYDITNADSFVNTKRWIAEVQENCGTDDNGISIILVGNKCDCEAQRVVALNDLKDYANAVNLKYFETSAKENINIDEVFYELTRLILEKKERIKENANSNSQTSKKSDNIVVDGNNLKYKRKKCC
jgi:Ras-related protein Rab-35